MRVQHFGGERIDPDAVHREVATQRGLREIQRRIRRHVEAAVPGTALAVAPRQGEVRVDVLDPEHAEGTPDRVHLAEAREEGFEPCNVEAEHLDVDVLGAHSKEVVTHPAAHDDGPSARVTDGGCDLVDRRIGLQVEGGHRGSGS